MNYRINRYEEEENRVGKKEIFISVIVEITDGELTGKVTEAGYWLTAQEYKDVKADESKIDSIISKVANLGQKSLIEQSEAENAEE